MEHKVGRKKTQSFSVHMPDRRIINYYSDSPESTKRFKRKQRCQSSSPTMFDSYAGAKFSEPPTADSIPAPPAAWFSPDIEPTVQSFFQSCAFAGAGHHSTDHFTRQLKSMLNVSA